MRPMPITVAREETKKKLVDVLNNSGVPAFVLVDILQNLLLELRQIERQQLEADRQKYEAELDEDENL